MQDGTRLKRETGSATLMALLVLIILSLLGMRSSGDLQHGK